MAKAKATENIDVGTASAALKAIPDGKVVDFISGRLMADTPEEYVRQNVEMSASPYTRWRNMSRRRV